MLRKSKKAQGLPISTIIIIILVIIVLAAVGLFFFIQFGAGVSQTSAGSEAANQSIGNLTQEAGTFFS